VWVSACWSNGHERSFQLVSKAACLGVGLVSVVALWILAYPYLSACPLLRPAAIHVLESL